MQNPRFFGAFSSRTALVAAIFASGGFAQIAFGASSGGGGPGSTVSIPYISGRLGPVGAPSDAPIGGVVPDDFCLPDKFEDCGEHLRDADDFSLTPQAQDGPIFVGGDNPAFILARTKLWGQAQFRQTNLNATSEQVEQRSFAIGGDHRFGDSFILGAMVVSTDMTTIFNLTGIEDAETGVQAGPYIAYRLSDAWALDARYIFGTSQHTVTTGGLETGTYESQGGFGALRISGTFDRGNIRLHPSLEFATIFQDSDAYVDGFRGPIASSTTADSFVTGAVLGYFNELGIGNGNIVPYVGIEISQPTSGTGQAFGVFRGGMALRMANGAVLNFDYAEGALGLSGIEDRLLALRLEIPL